jgi:TetR/AcrR family fatty acid metabolism transcriptional regulator
MTTRSNPRSSPRPPPRRPGDDDRQRKRRAIREGTVEVYRDAILAAAERVFGRSDFASAKMADIAREAGLAAGTLYNYFENKEQIFQSLIDARGEEFLKRFEAVFAEPSEPIERLRRSIQVGLEFLEEHQAMFQVFMELGAMSDWSLRRLCGEPAQARHERTVVLHERAIREGIAAGVLRRDIPAEMQAAFLIGAMQAFVRSWLSAKGPRPRRGLAEHTPTILSFLVDGLGAAK